MDRRSRQPGAISRPIGRQPPEPKWRRLFLGGATGSMDPSSTISASSDSLAESSVTVLGGTNTNKAGEGGLWYWTLGQRQYDFGRPHCLYLSLEMTSPPLTGVCNMYAAIGMCDVAEGGSSMPARNQLGARIHVDANPGPDHGTFAGGHNPTPSDSGANANRVGLIAQLMLGPGRRAWEYVTSWSYNDSMAWITTRQSTSGHTTGVPQPGTDLFVAVGRSNNVAGDATMGFRAHYLLFSTPPTITWRP